MRMPKPRLRAAILAVLASLVLSACATVPGERTGDPQPDGPIVVLVGIDGFRRDIIDRYDTPNMDRLAARGVRADGLIPVMPSLTFPNFYAIATGLHPGRNGVLDNQTYDRDLDKVFTFADGNDSRWFQGEPIWITAEKQGVTSATMFWVGSEAEYDGRRPTHWFPYEHTKPNGERIDQVLSWMDMDEGARPRFMSVYFSAIDSASHRFGVDSAEERAAVAEIDAQIGRLVDGIAARGLEDRVNLILVGDHGMTDFAMDRRIFLDDHTDLSGAKIPALANLNRANATFVGIFADEDTAGRIHADLKEAHPRMTVYRRGDLPERYHYEHPTRTPDLILVPDEGWLVTLREARPPTTYLAGHGYDPENRSMWAGFIADGPAIRDGVSVPAFANVNVHALVAFLLGIDPADTDGALSNADFVVEPALLREKEPRTPRRVRSGVY